MSAPWWRRVLAPRRLVPALAVALVLAAIAWLTLPTYLERREQAVEVSRLVKKGLSQADSTSYDDAWKILEEARSLAPMSREVLEAEEGLAMEWVRRNGLAGWTGGYVQAVLEKTLPVLQRAAGEATGGRKADLVAHLGWTEYLRGLTGGQGELHAIDNYRRALELDSRNVFAHAMWGFEILWMFPNDKEALDAARPHFTAAVESGREREYVRTVEISALLRAYAQLWSRNAGREMEAIRVMNDMRVKGEPRPTGFLKRRLWSMYEFDVVAEDNLPSLLPALPAADHLAAFRWAFPEDGLSANEGPSLFNYLYVLAQLQEKAGDRSGALASCRRVVEEFTRRKYPDSRAIRMNERANAALKRLSG
jgi:hypothetical protein